MFFTVLLGTLSLSLFAASRAPSPIAWDKSLPLLGGVVVLAGVFARDLWPRWRALLLALLIAHGLSIYAAWDLSVDVLGGTANPAFLLVAAVGAVGMLATGRRQTSEDAQVWEIAAVTLSLGIAGGIALVTVVLLQRDLVPLQTNFLIATKLLVSLLFVCGASRILDARASGLWVSVLTTLVFLSAALLSL